MTDLAIQGYSDSELIREGNRYNVYRARREATEAIVALKVLREPNLVWKKRWQREKQILERFSGQGIVELYDVMSDSRDRPVLVMRYMDRGTLEGKIGGVQLPIAEIFRIAHSLAKTLDALHEAGIIHHDIKPGNILFDEKDDVYLADFDIAFDSRSEDNLTTNGAYLGTPRYRTPEQRRGMRGKKQSDTYQLAIVVIEMITTRVMNPEYMELDHIINNLRDWGENISDILQKVFHDDPELRYETAVEFVADLERSVPWARRGDVPKYPISQELLAYIWRQLQEHRALLAVVDADEPGTALLNRLYDYLKEAPNAPRRVVLPRPIILDPMATPASEFWQRTGANQLKPDQTGQNVPRIIEQLKDEQREWLLLIGGFNRLIEEADPSYDSHFFRHFRALIEEREVLLFMTSVKTRHELQTIGHREQLWSPNRFYFDRVIEIRPLLNDGRWRSSSEDITN